MSDQRNAARGPGAGLRAGRGFALVLSLTVMSMLLLLAIGVASLLVLQLRVAQSSVVAARAQMNAMVGARIALGEIQRLLGPDRAVTANAAILASNGGSPDAGEVSEGVGRPRFVGVWKGLKTDAGLPVISPVKNYAADHDDAFAGWLASGRTRASGDIPLSSPADTQKPALLAWMKSPAMSRPAPGDWLMLDGGETPYAGAPALANRDPASLFATPEMISADPLGGEFAWVAMDENQKARVDLRHPVKTKNAQTEGLLATASAPGFRPDYAADGPSFSRRQERRLPASQVQLGWRSLPFEGPDAGWFPTEPGGATPSRALRHDFTTESVSLLTDTADGGLKRDLGLLALHDTGAFDALRDIGGFTGYIGFEGAGNDAGNRHGAWWRSKAASGIPRPVSIKGQSLQGNIWPIWSDVREWANFATTSRGGSATADNLSQPFLDAANGSPSINEITYRDLQLCYDQPLLGRPDRQYQANWRQPVLARYRMELRLRAVPSGTTPETYTVKPALNFAAVLWNPYNVRLKLHAEGAGDRMRIEGTQFPVMLRVNTPGNAPVVYNMQLAGGTIPLFGPDMEPGEFRVFSTPAQVAERGANDIPMQPGYSPSGGVPINTTLLGGVAGGTLVTVRFQTKDNRQVNGSYTNLMLRHSPSYGFQDGWCGSHGVEDQSLTSALKMLPGPGDPPAMNIPVDQFASVSGRPVGVMEYRMKTEKGVNTSTDGARASIGDYRSIHQALLFKDNSPRGFNTSTMEFVGWDAAGHGPENGPSMEVAANQAYGATGYTAGSGVTHHVARHIPLHPPVSLLSLTSARLGGGVRPLHMYDNYAPAVGQMKIESQTGMIDVRDAFGNALQNPWVMPDAVVSANNLQLACQGYKNNWLKAYDMSWIMNAALADSWFVSSLGAWDKGASAKLFPGLAKAPSTWLEEFFSGKNPLPDARYEPAEVNALAADYTGPENAVPGAHEKLAAAMRVKGGFNINSTSVRAWRAFLASTRPGADTATISGMNPAGQLTPVTLTPGGLPVLQSGVPGAPPSASPQSPASAAGRVNGGVVLTDAQIDALARAVVREVKTRGPFLTVSEFLNRRLENGESGQLGAVQAALRKSGADAYLNTTGYKLTDLATDNPGAVAAYSHSGVNGPGWLSQADLLRPLMTAVTARGDTFVVRCAGTATPGGSPVLYELTLRRTYDYLDTADAKTAAPADLKRVANKAFGRRFVIAAVSRIANDTP